MLCVCMSVKGGGLLYELRSLASDVYIDILHILIIQQLRKLL